MKTDHTPSRKPGRPVQKTFLRLLLPAFFFIACAISAPPSWGATASIEAVQPEKGFPAGGAYLLRFTVTVSESWFIHGLEESEGMLATRLDFPGEDPVRISQIRFPPPKKVRFPYLDQPIEVYDGGFTVSAALEVPGDAKPGRYRIEGVFFFQACSEATCRPPEEVRFPLEIEVLPPGAVAGGVEPPPADADAAAGDAAAKPGDGRWSGFWWTILGIFLGGLALNLTPCIYPLIPITVSYFGGKGGTLGGHPLLHGLFYIMGLAATNAALGAAASLSGGLLGAVLQSAWVLSGIALVLVLLALSFFGLWDLRLPPQLTRLAAKNYSGYFGTLFMGLTLGIVAAPCLGPFILGLLTVVGQKGDPVLGILYFTALSIGMGLPLTILGIFSGGLNRLPMSGDWMVWVRKLLGWVLIGMAAYMVFPLMPGSQARAALVAAILIAAGLHLGWIDRSGKGTGAFNIAKKTLGLVGILAALVYLYTGFQSRPGVPWVPYEPARLEEAASRRMPVILDFYADWCTPCRQMDATVFRDPEVVRLAEGFVPLKIDLTRRHPRQDELQQRYGLKGVPTIIFIGPDGNELEELRIESYTDKAGVLERMKRALGPPQ